MSTSTRPPRLGVALCILAALLAGPARAALFLSELCDPRLNYLTDRFIEIYNPDDAAVELGGWKIVAVANSVDVFTWDLSGEILPQEALVAGDATTVTEFPVDFADEAWSGANGNWNGRVGDGAKLVDPEGVITDLVVVTGAAFENKDYVRNPDVSAPNPVYTPSEWTGTAVDLATDASPGIHATESPLQGPVIAAIQSLPAWPAADDSVHVLADVTDATADITAVLARWGTAPDPLPNAITMLLASGDTYQTSAPIPPQAAGTTVYYRIEASNDVPATTVSPLQSYAIGYELTVHEVQGEAAASPYAGQIVTTQGVVTAAFGTSFAIQDGAGAWNGLWVRAATAPALADSVTVTGRVTESDGSGNAGNTLLVDAQIVSSSPGGVLPVALPVTTAGIAAEAYEGVLVGVEDAVCTDPDLGAGEWQIDDGSGACVAGVLGYHAAVTLGTTYAVTGPVAYTAGQFKLEPRDASDVVWTADEAAPVLLRAAGLSETLLRATFSEPVDSLSAGLAAYYLIPDVGVSAAARESGHPERVLLTVSPLATGDYSLTVSGVADLYGNVVAETNAAFSYTNPEIPSAYYDAAAGLNGAALQAALHAIIDEHSVHSYDYAWTAYYTTDDRPDNGMVWDIYSDIPGGTPPYLYTFGVDQGGVGGQEGTGYTREHTWCKSWFGGEVTPMYSDLFALYPCDTHMNGTRGVYPYGETASPQWTSLNGSKLGPSAVTGYAGTVFEPIDAFKGDLARVYFYFSTRYLGEDANWPGGPATDGAALRPWALDLFLAWDDEDPVSPKEIDRNNAVYAIQGNRNPFVDRPEFVSLLYNPPATGVDTAPAVASRLLGANPNPFNPQTTIAYELASASAVTLRVYDLHGRLVRRLLQAAPQGAGQQVAAWDGRDENGSRLPSGVYFCRLQAGSLDTAVKAVLLK
jgi:endonuclease I